MEYIEKVTKRSFRFDPVADKVIQREREKSYLIDFEENSITMPASDYIELRDAYFDLLKLHDDVMFKFTLEHINNNFNNIKENEDHE